MLAQLQDETGKPSVAHTGTEHGIFVTLCLDANRGVSCCRP
jgi:hypothetical protein